MKISIYDLLGMIKDGKAPQKILIRFKDINERIIDEETFEYAEKFKDYFDEHDDRLFEDYDWIEILNDEVTILETTITYKPDKIVELNMFGETDFFDYRLALNQTRRKINEIIDYILKD